MQEATRRAFGSWHDRELEGELDGETWVEGVRSGSTAILNRAELLTLNIRHFPMFPNLRRPY